MDILVFQLRGALASWGDVAVGEYRGSSERPSESALIGLLGAALGIRRDDERAHNSLQASYGFAVGTQAGGLMLRDYHTAQVPGRAALKGRPHATRKDELSLPKEQLSTILSTRDYRQGGACLVAVQSHHGAPYALEQVSEALRRPRFTLYLGRKCCPPSAPLHPRIITAPSAHRALRSYLHELESLRIPHKDSGGRIPLEPPGELTRLSWGERVEAGLRADLSAPRKDRLIRRRSWQFGDRTEYTAGLGGGE